MTCSRNLVQQLIDAIAQFNTNIQFLYYAETFKLQTCTALQHQVLNKLHWRVLQHHQNCRQHQEKKKERGEKTFDHTFKRCCHWGPFPYVWVLISQLQRSTNQRELQQHQEYKIYAAQSPLHSLRGLVQKWLKFKQKSINKKKKT